MFLYSNFELHEKFNASNLHLTVYYCPGMYKVDTVIQM